jgi:hypothetical protein
LSIDSRAFLSIGPWTLSDLGPSTDPEKVAPLLPALLKPVTAGFTGKIPWRGAPLKSPPFRKI